MRGFSAPSLVLIDEAAQVDDVLYRAVLPMLIVSRGRFILLSTPYGKRGFFWHAWEKEPDWKKIKITADECPRIREDDLERDRSGQAESWFRQEYYCEFVQDEGTVFKEEWIQDHDPDTVPNMNDIFQSWDTAATKSGASDYVVGQVWGRRGADFYLLDQVRGRWDFDETVDALKRVTATWHQSSAILIEAQTLGPALASHLKTQIPGIIPIHVKEKKRLRAMSCVPAWRSGNVYIPEPDARSWVRDYVFELTNFPDATYDDQVDATTLALNQLRGSLFPNVKAVAKPTKAKSVKSGHDYVVGWIPARSDDEFTVIVYDQKDDEVVHFYRLPARPLQQQVKAIYHTSVYFNGAVVRVIEGFDEALIYGAELQGTYIQKVKFTKAKRDAAYDNLSLLIERQLITVPEYPELMAELSVFKSAFTYDEQPDYSLQIAQQSGIDVLCLVTHDLDPTMWEYHPDIYYSFDPDRLDPSLWFPYDNSRQHYPF